MEPLVYQGLFVSSNLRNVKLLKESSRSFYTSLSVKLQA